MTTVRLPPPPVVPPGPGLLLPPPPLPRAIVPFTPPSNAEGAVTAAAENPSPDPSVDPQLTPKPASAITDATITSLFMCLLPAEQSRQYTVVKAMVSNPCFTARDRRKTAKFRVFQPDEGVRIPTTK